MAFNQVKTAQVASWIIAKCGNPIEVLKLMKLLYLVDRRAMELYGYSVTGDRMVSMPHGPVLSQTLAVINGAGRPDTQGGWDSRMTDREGRRIGLKPGVDVSPDALDELSDMDLQIMEEVVNEHGARRAWDLREYTHNECPEWEDPQGSSRPISSEQLFSAFGFGDQKVARLSDMHKSDDSIDFIFSQV